MILTCPSCGTRFAVDARAIGVTGRRVKCSRCAEVWFTEADPAELAALADVQPPPSPTIKVEPRPIPPGSGLPALRGPQPPPPKSRLGWMLFLATLVALLAAGWFGRAAVVTAWPPAARIYAAIGVDVGHNGPPLELTVTPARRQTIDGVAVIVIEGTVRNRSKDEQILPQLRAVARAADGSELYGWTFNAALPRLKPGEMSSFSTRLDRPVAGAADIAVTLGEVPAASAH